MILVYVDAENVNVCDTSAEMAKIRMNAVEERVCGKFYGAKDVISSLVSDYYDMGMEYVETSSITANRKNVADMKIAVDCIFDVMNADMHRISAVYIISHDSDFLPLVYKLRTVGINAVLPFSDMHAPTCSLSDLNILLQNSEYSPMDTDEWLAAPYQSLKSYTDGQIEDSIVSRYVSRRRLRFDKEIMKFLPSEALTQLHEISVEDFSIQSVFGCLHNLCDADLFPAVLNAYTKRFFGRSFQQSEISGKLVSALGGD